MKFHLFLAVISICLSLSACKFDNAGRQTSPSDGPPPDTFRVEVDPALLAPNPATAKRAALTLQPLKGFDILNTAEIAGKPGAEEDFGRLASMLRLEAFKLEMLLADTATSAMIAVAAAAPLADTSAARLLASAKERNAELKEWEVFSEQRVVLNGADGYQLMLRAANQEVVGLLFPRTDAPSALVLAQLPSEFTSKPANMQRIQSLLGTVKPVPAF